MKQTLKIKEMFEDFTKNQYNEVDFGAKYLKPEQSLFEQNEIQAESLYSAKRPALKTTS